MHGEVDNYTLLFKPIGLHCRSPEPQPIYLIPSYIRLATLNCVELLYQSIAKQLLRFFHAGNQHVYLTWLHGTKRKKEKDGLKKDCGYACRIVELD
jgi:hypothetical protein